MHFGRIGNDFLQDYSSVYLLERQGDCTLILLTVVMAVSAEEKNAESKIRIITAVNWKIVLESKVVSLLLILNIMCLTENIPYFLWKIKNKNRKGGV